MSSPVPPSFSWQEALDENLRETKELLGPGVAPSAIEKARKQMTGFVNRLMLINRNREPRPESSLLKIREKVQANLDWLGPYGVTKAHWGKALDKCVTLSSYSPETLKKNFEDDAAWLRAYDIKPDQLAKIILKSPRMLSMKAQKLKARFGVFSRSLSKYNPANEQLLKAIVRHPHLLLEKPKRLRSNFRRNLRWLKAYGANDNTWVASALNEPPLFYNRPQKLRRSFELALVISRLLPERFSNGAAYAEPDFIDWMLSSRPIILTYADNNFLLRMAFAEMTRPSSSALVLKSTREKVERMVVSALGHDPDNHLVPLVDADLADAEVRKRKAEESAVRLRICAEKLTRRIRKDPLAANVQGFDTRVTSVLLPRTPWNKNDENSRRLLQNLALSGLLKSYRLAP